MKKSDIQSAENFRRQRGSALIATMFVVAIIALEATTMYALVGQQMTTSKNSMYRADARNLANGAAERAVAWLTQNPTLYTAVPTSLTRGTLGNGTVSVTVNDLSGTCPNLLQIVSTATVNNVAVTARVYFKRPTTGSLALGYGIFTNNNLDLGGTPDVYASTWTNASLTGNGSAAVHGTATYVISNTSKIAGTKASGPIDFPQIDSDYYYQIALADSQVWTFDGTTYTNATTGTTKSTSASVTFTPTQGIVWVNCTPTGATNIKLSGTKKGTLTVTDGSLFIKGAGSIDATGNGTIFITPKAGTTTTYACPALVLLDGNLSLGGNSGLLGCCFVANGTASMTGTSDFYGSLISYGEVSMQGTAKLDPRGKTFDLQTLGSNLFQMSMWER